MPGSETLETKTACLRCGTFVAESERALREPVFCRPCVEGPAPGVTDRGAGVPNRVRTRMSLQLLVAFALAVATAVACWRGGVVPLTGLPVALVFFLPWAIVVFLVTPDRGAPHWRELARERHGMSDEAASAAMLAHYHPRTDRPSEIGLLFEGEEGFAFFGTRGTRTLVRFDEIDRAQCELFLRWPLFARLERGDEPLFVSSYAGGATGRAWIRRLVERASRARG